MRSAIRLLGLAFLTAVPVSAQIPRATYTAVATQPTVGETPAGSSLPLASSANGRYLLYQSEAPNVLAGQFDPNGSYDLFLHDLVIGDTQLVSRSFASHLRCAAGFSEGPFLSPDGRYVLFSSNASDILAPGLDSNFDFVVGSDIFEYDRITRTNRLISSRWDDPGRPSEFGALLWDVTTDLRFLALESYSNDLVAGLADGNNTVDVFLFDRSLGTRRLVSHAAGQPTVASNSASEAPSLSADGRFVLYLSYSTDLLPGYGNPSGRTQLFRYDTQTQTNVLVSRSATSAVTAAGGETLRGATMSPNGRWILFSSTGSNLVPGQVDTNGGEDLFLFDADTGVTTLVSHLPGLPSSTPANSGTSSRSLSADGRYVVYGSYVPDLVAGATDTNGTNDGFLFDRTTGVNRLLSHLPGNPLQAANGQTFVGFSGDLRNIVLATLATDLGVVDSNGGFDLFLYDATTSTLRLVSHALSSPLTTGNGASALSGIVEPILDRVLFASAATDLVSGQDDQNGRRDLFSLQLSTGTISALSGFPAPVVPVTPTNGVFKAIASEDGRFVAYSRSLGDGSPPQLFLLDRQGGDTVLVSHSFGQPTVASNERAFATFVSADGRFILFESTATDLVASFVPGGDSFPEYLYDRTTGRAELLAPAVTNPNQAANRSTFGRITPDGRYALVSSQATDLLAGFVPSGDQDSHLFLRDRLNGTTTLVDHAAGLPLAAVNGNGSGSLSRDGRYVILTSSATNLVAGLNDSNGASPDAFLLDRLSGQFELLSPSISASNSTGNRFTSAGGLSADGRFVVLTSAASDLAPGVSDTPGTTDVFVRDRLLGTTELISHVGGAPFTAAGLSDGLFLSDDARFVLFRSSSGQLVPTTPPVSSSVYLYDRAAHLATRVTSSAYDPTTAVPARAVALSASGRYTLFSSEHWIHVAGFVDRNGSEDDLFLYDHGTGRTVVVTHPPYAPDLRSGLRGATIFSATMSRNGNVLTFESIASDFLLNDSNLRSDVVVVSTEIFVDGFESGGTGRWSLVVP